MKKFIGTVVKKSGKQTIKVEVEQLKVHPLYGKRYRVHRYFMVHDDEGKHNVGDTVTFTETRPISKRKHFRLVEEKSEVRSTKLETNSNDQNSKQTNTLG